MSRKPKGKILIHADFSPGFSSVVPWHIVITDTGWLWQTLNSDSNWVQKVFIGEDKVFGLLLLMEEKDFVHWKPRLIGKNEHMTDLCSFWIGLDWEGREYGVSVYAGGNTPEIKAFFEVWDAIHQHAPISDKGHV
jgi:hypothetical protein